MLCFDFEQIARNLLPAPQLEDLTAAQIVLAQTETEIALSNIVAQGLHKPVVFCLDFVFILK